MANGLRATTAPGVCTASTAAGICSGPSDRTALGRDVRCRTRPVRRPAGRCRLSHAARRLAARCAWHPREHNPLVDEPRIRGAPLGRHAGPGGRDVGVESGTGTGKSFLVAGAILWFLACWEGARAFTFAPKEDQLRLYIWAEMSKMWPRFAIRFPQAEITDLRIRMAGDDTWGAWGYAVGVRAGEQVATKAAGMHAPHMLLVNEETPGIPLPVLEAQRNTVTGAHNLRVSVGNPDSEQDTLHQFCREPGVIHVRISALDHPNVVLGTEAIPGAVTKQSVASRIALYGEGSPMADSRIRGISPPQAPDALIQAAWLDAAIARFNDENFRKGRRAL